MINKEFIGYISTKTKIKQKELIEKDLILQYLLKELQSNKYFSKNFVFKGGTCLIKCYLGYYRFSEDLDFSWINQEVLKNKSEKQKRKYLSNEIDKILDILEVISKKLSLDFQKTKTNKNYVELGGNNKFATFKIWYNSNLLNIKQLIKIQINFVEIFKYKFKTIIPKAIIRDVDLQDTSFLFPKDTQILRYKIKIKAYDLKEIMLEKIRAILTRQGIKIRDFIDVYFIVRSLKIKLNDYKKEILEKTIFMLKYEKYLKNLLKKENLFEESIFKDKESLLLREVGEDFDEYVKDILNFLNTLLKEIKKYLNGH